MPVLNAVLSRMMATIAANPFLVEPRPAADQLWVLTLSSYASAAAFRIHLEPASRK